MGGCEWLAEVRERSNYTDVVSNHLEADARNDALNKAGELGATMWCGRPLGGTARTPRSIAPAAFNSDGRGLFRRRRGLGGEWASDWRGLIGGA